MMALAGQWPEAASLSGTEGEDENQWYCGLGSNIKEKKCTTALNSAVSKVRVFRSSLVRMCFLGGGGSSHEFVVGWMQLPHINHDCSRDLRPDSC